MLRRLALDRVVQSPNLAWVPTDSSGVVELQNLYTEEVEQRADVDLVVVAGRRQSETSLKDALRTEAPELPVTLVGDALAPRTLLDAVAEGARAGAAIEIGRPVSDPRSDRAVRSRTWSSPDRYRAPSQSLCPPAVAAVGVRARLPCWTRERPVGRRSIGSWTRLDSPTLTGQSRFQRALMAHHEATVAVMVQTHPYRQVHSRLRHSTRTRAPRRQRWRPPVGLGPLGRPRGPNMCRRYPYVEERMLRQSRASRRRLQRRRRVCPAGDDVFLIASYFHATNAPKTAK